MFVIFFVQEMNWTNASPLRYSTLKRLHDYTCIEKKWSKEWWKCGGMKMWGAWAALEAAHGRPHGRPMGASIYPTYIIWFHSELKNHSWVHSQRLPPWRFYQSHQLIINRCNSKTIGPKDHEGEASANRLTKWASHLRSLSKGFFSWTTDRSSIKISRSGPWMRIIQNDVQLPLVMVSRSWRYL